MDDDSEVEMGIQCPSCRNYIIHGYTFHLDYCEPTHQFYDHIKRIATHEFQKLKAPKRVHLLSLRIYAKEDHIRIRLDYADRIVSFARINETKDV